MSDQENEVNGATQDSERRQLDGEVITGDDAGRVREGPLQGREA
jgi:hypothetical protein